MTMTRDPNTETIRLQIQSDGSVKVWYPDGDLCAVIYGNLGMDIDSWDLAKMVRSTINMYLLKKEASHD